MKLIYSHPISFYLQPLPNLIFTPLYQTSFHPYCQPNYYTLLLILTLIEQFEGATVLFLPQFHTLFLLKFAFR